MAPGPDAFIAKSAAMKSVLAWVRRVTNTSVPVALFGETGTGKEAIAARIHLAGHRAHGPYVPVNCGAVPESLIESELFGTCRGAYTSAASDRAGLIEVAHRGTLFLDEVGDLPLPLQTRLLRFLDTGEVRRLGETKVRRVDVRVISATNRDLRAEVQANRFRADLFFRLSVAPCVLPPLRERGGGGGGGGSSSLAELGVWVDLAGSDRVFKLSRVDVADGETVVDNVGGLEVRRNANPNDDYYMYFNIDDGFAANGSHPNMFLTFHYWDGPSTTLWIQYDSTAGAYTNGPSITTQGTNKWKTKTFEFSNAYFGNRQNNGADFRIASIPGTYFYIDLVYARQVLPRFPFSVQFNPQYHPWVQPMYPTNFLSVCLNPANWPQGITKIEYFGGGAHGLAEGNPPYMTECFNILKQRGIRLVMEVPALKHWCTTGQACYDATYPTLDYLQGLGASLDAIAIDLARSATKDPSQPPLYPQSLSYAAQHVAHYLQLMRNRYPYMQIFSIENHLLMNTTELAQWVEVLNEECARIGTPIIDMLVVDHDYNDPSLANDRLNMPWLRQTVNEYGPRFGIAYFGSGASSDYEYYTKVMNQGNAFNNLGVNPQLYWVTSWDPYPSTFVPESSAYTNTYTLLQFLTYILGR